MNCLILCAGKTRRSGWKTLDANPTCEPDYVCNIPPLPSEVTSIKWNTVEWIHGITSFYPWEAADLLMEIHEILADDGKLILEQPDFNRVAGRMEWIFGDPTFADPLHMNRWGWSPGSLTAALEIAGYSKVMTGPAKYHNINRDFRAEAWR